MRPRPTGLITTAAAVAIATVAVAVAVTGSSVAAATSAPPDSSDPGATVDAERDAAIVCAELATVPERLDGVDQFPDLDDPLLWRLQGIGALAQAVGLGDPGLADIGSAGEQLLRAWSVIDPDATNEALATLRSSCDDTAPTVGDDTATPASIITDGAAALDADSTCTLVDDVDEGFVVMEMPGLDHPLLWQLQAISGFGEAAGRGDAAYAALGDAAADLYTAIQLFDQDKFDVAIGQLRDECSAVSTPTTTAATTDATTTDADE